MRKFWIIGGVLVILALASFVFVKSKDNKSPSSSASENKQHYVALGDSVAAGQGLADASDSSACNRTNESYPNQLASNKNLQLKSVACSGATIKVGLLGSQTVNGAVLNPQIEQVTKDMAIVTITTGANDANWSQVIPNCFLGTCGTAQDTAQNLAKVQILAQNLKELFTALQAKISPNAKVYITGYYQIFPASNAACQQASGLTDAELTWLHGQTELLNAIIEASTEDFAFSQFVPVDFNGHEACTSNSWVQSIQEPAPFHPTEDGQAAISKAIAAAL